MKSYARLLVCVSAPSEGLTVTDLTGLNKTLAEERDSFGAYSRRLGRKRFLVNSDHLPPISGWRHLFAGTRGSVPHARDFTPG
jgi:hypothetical protein